MRLAGWDEHLPQPAQVINYWYSWGKDEAGKTIPAEKPRPCVILTVKETEHGTRVRLAPITHSEPRTPHDGIPLSKATCARLGLDDLPQWVITRNNNIDYFPSRDVEPIRGSNPPSAQYGVLPAKLGQTLKQQTARNHRLGKLIQVQRDKGVDREKDQGIER